MSRQATKREPKGEGVVTRGSVWWRRLKLVSPVLGVMAALGAVLPAMQNEQWFPVNRLAVDGTFTHVQVEEVVEVVKPTTAGKSFFMCDLAQVIERVEGLPWVDRAEARRVWPDRLQITLIEQQPLARWGDDGLLNSRGEVFRPPRGSMPTGLPRLRGPEQTNQLVAQHYVMLQNSLSRAGLDVSQLTLDERRAWRMVVDNGMEIVLGRALDRERLQRFVRIYPKVLADKADAVGRVDLRYPNGFAVSWRKPPMVNEDAIIG